MSIFSGVNNPGIDISQFTPAEQTILAGFADLPLSQGDLLYVNSSGVWAVLAPGTSGYVLATQGAGANPHWINPAVGGTVSSVSVVTANGFAGTVANATTTPAITLTTSVTGILKGNGTSVSAASPGTDYAPATSGGAILYGNGAGGFSSVTVGSGLNFTTGTLAVSGLTNSNLSGSAGITNANLATSSITIAGTATSLGSSITQDTITGLSSTGIIKRTAANTLAIATADTDYSTPAGSETFTNKTIDTAGTGNSIKIGGYALPTTLGTANQVLSVNSGATGILWATPAGGGNVSNSGTPTNGQIAQWTNATTIQGITLVPVTAGGTGSASVIVVPAASTWSGWDANKNYSANNLIDGFTTTATAAGTTTLTIASTGIQVFTGSTTQTVILPTTSVVAGGQYTIINQSTGLVTVQSSGANTITILGANTSAVFTAVVATPTTAANWNSQYFGANVTSGKVLSSSNTLTLAGTDATTMTFPSSSDTVVTLAATQTLTNKTLTTPTINQVNASASTSIKWNAGTYRPYTTDTDGVTVTFDLSASDLHNVTLGGNRTLALSNANTGQVFTIVLVQDATGSRTVTWFSTIKWAGGTAPTLTTTAGKADAFTFICYGTGTYYGTVAGQNF